ncbi:hypothetical protein WBG78_30650 [Chryseolinea sp. T2]|uniref:hypothetical protein n=1 Tax=Chryseolinea sp. T2 TaxID=3129255 RepID=UPI0030779B45
MHQTKKVWFSSPLKFFWEELYGRQKKLTPHFSDENIFKILRDNLIDAALAAEGNIESRELMVSGLELWREDSKGDLLHIFFLEKYLQDFLERTPLSDLDGIRRYLYENGEEKKVKFFRTNSQSTCVVYSFGLHIPREVHGYAFLLTLYQNGIVELYFSHGKQNGRISDNFYADWNKKSDAKSIAMSKMFRLAINTIAYMKCFPECVTEGVPKISDGINKKRSEYNFTFRLSEKIADSGNVVSKIPHFRKGHFRLLQSDYYAQKQGQLIYVTETMVKGKAKTVSTSERIEEFDIVNKGK